MSYPLPTPELVAGCVPSADVPAALALVRAFAATTYAGGDPRAIIVRPGPPLEAARALTRAGILEETGTHPDQYRPATSRDVIL